MSHIDMTTEDVAIRANVLSRFAHRVWNDPQYKPSEAARSPLMALHESYRAERAVIVELPAELVRAATRFFRYHSGGGRS
jgi:hypothetical protein